MGRIVRNFFMMAVLAGAAAFAYEYLLDDETRDRVCDSAQSAAAQVQDVVDKVSTVVRTTSIEDLQSMADNNAWVAKQWHDIGY